MTRLESFLKRTKIKPKELAGLARIRRQHLLRVGRGQVDPTRHVVVQLTMASAIILRRLVNPDELFDLAAIGKDETRARRRR